MITLPYRKTAGPTRAFDNAVATRCHGDALAAVLALKRLDRDEQVAPDSYLGATARAVRPSSASWYWRTAAMIASTAAMIPA